MKKQLLPLVLCTSLLASVPVFGEVPVADTDSMRQIGTVEVQAPIRQLSYVAIKEIRSADGNINGFSASDQEGNHKDYTLTANTLILDVSTGKAASTAFLTKDMNAYLFHAPNGTEVEAVVINMPQDAGCPMLHDVESLHDMGETLQITTDNGGLHLFVKDTVPVSSFSDGTKKAIDAIQVGSRIFAWYDMVLESYPAQTHPTQIMLIPAEAKADFTVVLNGRETDIKAKTLDGTLFIPLRETATLLDCQVAWDKDTRTTILSNEKRKMRISLGDDLYASFAADPRLSGMTAPKKLGKSYLDQGTLYVPADIFSVLVGFQVTVTDSTLSIAKK